MAKAKTAKVAKTVGSIPIYEDVQVEIIPIDRIQLNPHNRKKQTYKERQKGLNR